MTLFLKIIFPNHLVFNDADRDEWVARVNGLICTNGSKVVVRSMNRIAYLEFNDGRAIPKLVSPQEAATFIRNFYDEGFEEQIDIVPGI